MTVIGWSYVWLDLQWIRLEEALSLHPELSLVQPVCCKLTQMVRLSMKLSWRLATLFLA